MKKLLNFIVASVFFLSFNVIEAQVAKKPISNPEIIKKYEDKLKNGFKLEQMEVKEFAYALFENNQYKNSLKYLKEISNIFVEDDYLHFMLNHAYKANNEFIKGNESLDYYYKRRKKSYDKNIKDLDLLEQLGDRYIVKEFTKINTPASDIFNYEDANFIYYSSNNERNNIKEKKSVWNEKYFYNEYIFSKKDSTISSIKNINTNYHDSNIVFTKDKKMGFITSNEMNKNAFYKKDEIIQLSIYMLTYDDKGKLLEKKYMPFNSNEYSCKNPYYNENTKLLYFSSNMPNGSRGGYDIYSWDIEKDKLRNLTEINSINDENDVFMDENRDLYFSSNGYYGFGGLDIFHTKYNPVKKKYDRVMNIGFPVNSNSDDFAMYIKDKKGFFTSKRKGSDDIYSFVEFKDLSLDTPYRILKGNIKLVNNEKIEYFDSIKINFFENEKDSTRLQIIKDDLSFEQRFNSSSYILKLEPNDDYELVTSKIELGDKFFTTTNQDIILKPGPPINIYQGTVFNGTQNVPLKNLKITISDLDKKVIAFVLTNDKGEYSIKVPANKNYIIQTEYECKKPYLPNYIEYLNPTSQKKIKKDIILREVSVCGLQVNEKNKLLVETNPILFDVNKYIITEDAKIELNKVIEILKYDKNFKLKVNSHTDNQGSEKHNLLLSENRAKATVNYILSQGIEKDRISYLFFGESKPLFDCKEKCTTLEMAKNRRSEFELE